MRQPSRERAAPPRARSSRRGRGEPRRRPQFFFQRYTHTHLFSFGSCGHPSHGATPGTGTERGVKRIHGEGPWPLQSVHLSADELSGGEPQRSGPGERADPAARGAQAPRSPAAAAARVAKASFALSARFARLLSWLCSRCGDPPRSSMAGFRGARHERAWRARRLDPHDQMRRDFAIKRGARSP